jgi:PilZ domain/Gram-negative bacterial TonB protein C-terminal
MSALTDHLAATNTPIERRFYARVAPQTPATISFATDIPSHSPSRLLNLSENGLLLSMAGALVVNSVHRVSLDLDGVPKIINVYVRTVWTENSHEIAGIQLLDLSEHDRELIRRWSALQSPRGSTFGTSQAPEAAAASAPPSDAIIGVHDCASWQPAAELVPLPSELRAHALLGAHSVRKNDASSFAITESQTPVNSSASPLYFWGAALTVMCLGTVWASTHDVLGDFRTPKVSHSPIASSARSRRPSAPNFQPSNPQSESGPATPAPESSSTVASPPSEPVTVTKPEAPKPVSNAPANAHKKFPEASGSLPSANVVDSTPTPKPVSRDVVPQPAPTTSSQPEIPRNALVGKSAIVGSTRLPASPPSSTLNPISSSTPTANSVQPPSLPPSGYSSSTPATAPLPTIPSTVASPSPDVNARDAAAKPFIVQVPVPGTDGLVSLPGERIINSPSVTMHIQRSVWLRGGLRFWSRHKKVEVGQLSAHGNPQTPRAPLSGSITVQARIDQQGRVTGIKPLYGSIAFLPAVSRALSTWRYQPTYVDNKPVETVARIEVNFHSPSARFYRP